MRLRARATKAEIEIRREKTVEVITALQTWWPLSVRQVFYQLVSKQIIQNSRSMYQAVSQMLTQLRHSGEVSWRSISDDTRTTVEKRGFHDPAEYLKVEMEAFMEQYDRCRVQSQEIYLEVWLEKHALARIFNRTVWPYCVRLIVGRGYDSTTYLHLFRERAEAALSSDKRIVVLQFGDYDASGVDIVRSARDKLEEDFGLWDFEIKRAALTEEQIIQYDLPNDPFAVKERDPRAAKFIQDRGRYAVELDALHPSTLQEILKGAIEAEFDMDAFHQERAKEKEERLKLEELRLETLAFIQWKREQLGV